MAEPAADASLRRLLARNTAANWTSYLAAGLTTLVLTPYVVGSLGASGYGVWILLTQLAGYGAILELGVQAGLAKHIAAAHATGDARKLTEYASSAAAFHVLVASVVVGAAVFFGPRLTQWFNIQTVDPREAALTLRVLAAATALGVLSLVFSASLKGHMRFDLLAIVQIASNLVRAIGVVLVVTWGLGLPALALSSLSAAAVVLAGAAYFASYALRPQRLIEPRVSRAALRDLLGFGLFAVVSLAGWTLAYASDAIIVGRLLTTVDVAQLGLGLSVAAMISGVIGAFAQNFMPLASSLRTRDASGRLRTAYLLGTRWCLLLSVPCVLLGLLWGPDLLRAWVGPELGTPAGGLLGLLLLAFLPTMANSVGYQMGLAAELHRHAAWISLGEGLTKVCLSISLAAPFGLRGVVWGSLIASAICNGLIWPALLRSRLSVTWREVLRDSVVPALWPVLPAFACGLVVARLSSAQVRLAAPFVAALVYAALAAWANRRDLQLILRRTPPAPVADGGRAELLGR